MDKRLYRSRENRVISGVCGGIAEYFDLDPTLVRLLWVLVTFFVGVGIIGYIICIFVIPERPSSHTDKVQPCREEEDTGGRSGNKAPSRERNRIFAGIILILLGVLLLADRLKLLYWLDLDRLWPVLLIIGGLYIIYRGKEGK